jgi:hypothetical protein
MPLYFLLLDRRTFEEQLRPALAASWRQRSFATCEPLLATLLPAAAAFAERYHTGGSAPLLGRVADGLPFDRNIWRYLVSEVLMFGAADIPDIQTAPETLGWLLARDRLPEGVLERQRLAPIRQAHHGSRDLVFGGGFYRPEHAGYNDGNDVARLADYLAAVDPDRWTAADLAGLPGLADEDERAEELEFVREWFPALRDLYVRAREQDQIVICEIF